MSDPEYVAIGHAARVLGVPGKTLRRWVEDGQLPVTAGQPKRVVRLEDARRLAAMTGLQPDTADAAVADAGQMAEHTAEAVTGENTPVSSGSVSATARSQPEAFRQEWLQPVIDQLREAELIIRRLEAERDQIAQERDALRAELAAAQAPRAPDPGPVRDNAGERE